MNTKWWFPFRWLSERTIRTKLTFFVLLAAAGPLFAACLLFVAAGGRMALIVGQHLPQVALAVTVASLFLACLLARALWRVIARPILDLASAARAVAERRDYSVRVKQNGGELGLLCDWFNNATTQIQERERELERHRLHLEELVSERTRDLAVNAQEALAASVAKSRFLATMSHEIRTPMNGVIGMLRLLRNTCLTKQQEHYTVTAIASVDTLMTVINDILDFSKIEAGKLEIETLDFDLIATIEGITQTFAERARNKNIELVCQIASNLPTRLRGDPNRLAQILSKFVGNALKFTEKGEVVITASVVEQDEARVAVRIAVRDSGIGIPPEHQACLFQPFGEGDSSTTRKYEGTGLGLTICKQLAELMGGTIGVESHAGRGSTFWLCLSLEKQPLTASAVFPRAVRLRGLPVVIVDDSEANREILRQQLSAWGCDVQDAGDAQSALTVMHRAADAGRPFALGILDRDMLVQDGMELAVAIKSDARLRSTTLILLSAIGGEGSERLRQAGVTECLSKPVRQTDLFNAIATALVRTAPLRAPKPPPRPIAPLVPVAKPGIRILIAEDNEINREVATGILRTLGYEYDCATNGRDAVNAAISQGYDLILMDCQMPGMDGYEATTNIRAREAAQERLHGVHARTPIVALTANAIKGDRERCLECGMDDYLTKPLDPPLVGETIAKWLDSSAAHVKEVVEQAVTPAPPADPRPVEEKGSASAVREPVFDESALLRRCGNNPAFVASILDKFRVRARSDVQELEQAFLQGDAERLAGLTHRLKGTCLSLSAGAMAQAAGEVESAVRAANLPQAGSKLRALKDELSFFEDTADRFLPTLHAQALPDGRRNA